MEMDDTSMDNPNEFINGLVVDYLHNYPILSGNLSVCY